MLGHYSRRFVNAHSEDFMHSDSLWEKRMKLTWKGLAAIAAVVVVAIFAAQFSSDKSQQEAQEAEDREAVEAMVLEIQHGVTPPPARGVVQRSLKPLPEAPIPEDMQEVPADADGSHSLGARAVLRDSRRLNKVLLFVDRFGAAETLSESTKDQLRNVLLSESDAELGALGAKDQGRVAAARREAEKLARSLLTNRQFDEFRRIRENERRTSPVPFR
jgi:hypothetical protein